MVIRRIEPMSAAKVGGMLYALLGLLIGVIFTLISFTGMGMMGAGSGMGSYSMMFGAGAIIILPILYGILGFIFCGISAAFYNLAAKLAGGLEVQTD
jgi:hypothetical protein